MATTRRVMKELKEIEDYIKSEPTDNHRFLEIKTINDDILRMEVTFLGPKESPYEEILNTISIQIPKEYPHRAPNMNFKSKIYHPNVGSSGNICLDILKDQWRPIYTLRTTIMSIISLLNDPNPDSPLNGEAARKYKDGLKSVNARRSYAKDILKNSSGNY
jgi:ubiquitin-protein ligase